MIAPSSSCLMTWNPFAGRHLSHNPPRPVSPNLETIRRNRVVPKPFRVVAVWSLSGTFSGHAVTLPARQSFVPWVATHSFVLTVQSQQGDNGELRVGWDMFDTPFFCAVQMDFGAGMNVIANATGFGYPTGTPYISGDLPWDAGVGSVKVSLSGNNEP